MLKPKFNINDFKKALEGKREAFVQAAQLRLQRVGENFVNNARNNGTYQDHTGNLRSSVGYRLYSNGVMVNENFKALPAASQIKDKELLALIGVEKAQALLDEIATQYPRGLALVVVAGMEYAAAVESKNFDVITGSGLIAAAELKKSFEELQQKMNKS